MQCYRYVLFMIFLALEGFASKQPIALPLSCIPQVRRPGIEPGWQEKKFTRLGRKVKKVADNFWKNSSKIEVFVAGKLLSCCLLSVPETVIQCMIFFRGCSLFNGNKRWYGLQHDDENPACSIYTEVWKKGVFISVKLQSNWFTWKFREIKCRIFFSAWLIVHISRTQKGIKAQFLRLFLEISSLAKNLLGQSKMTKNYV